MLSFDRTIDTRLDPELLWELVVEAFEDPANSRIWPIELDEVSPITLRPGATLSATYRFGPLHTHQNYMITEVVDGQSLSYCSQASHPLKGGATLSVLESLKGSQLRWVGSYRPRLHPLAPGALLFVRLYFLNAFFARLEHRLRLQEELLDHQPQATRV
ncbi:hypothetical protein DL240_11355 [Lujinxingia litoralis]|uniref:SRPBCC family protein n=1 Tax=Lujinxingia litoralis TaxID=2211119 RepID=A0A328C611_9DELT|nr:SRPBCC family protein [Lujinxingia litoralis]RAL22436.1 hypothetical protein DL240_11355 [Lujinxingia litoralis]